MTKHHQVLQGEAFDLRSLTTEYDARSDIKSNGLWEFSFKKTYFDFRNFDPLANNLFESSSEAYKYQESIKKSRKERRIIDV